MGGQLHVSSHPLVRHKLAALRDAGTPPADFRSLVDEITGLLAYEATRELDLEPRRVTTPLAAVDAETLRGSICLIPILRAGLGMVPPFLRLCPEAAVWHLGVYRDEESLQPVEYYNKLGTLSPAHTCFLLDPMLATGGSAIAAAEILRRAKPGRVVFVGLIGAPEGVKAFQTAHSDIDVHLAALDERLTPSPKAPGDLPAGYIVPGLGDAGDRQFGTAV